MYDFERVNVEDEKGKFKVCKGKNDSLHTFLPDSEDGFISIQDDLSKQYLVFEISFLWPINKSLA